MKSLSIDLYLHILSYLDQKDQIEWGSCCQYWYKEIVRRDLRILQIHLKSWQNQWKLQVLIETIPKLIQNPSRQLELYVQGPTYINHLYQLLESVNFTVKVLVCSIPTFCACVAVNTNISFSVRNFHNFVSSCFLSSGSEAEFLLTLQHLRSVEKLSLNMDNANFSIPKINNIEEVSIMHCLYTDFYFFDLSLSQLRKVYLIDCSISDVSMFGCIPELTIVDCANIIDISKLNNNKYIFIQN